METTTFFTNPFIVAVAIVIVLNLMMYVLLRPKAKSKVYFRAIFYMWIVTTGMFYFYHSKVEEEMKKKLNTNLSMNIINKPVTDELAPTMMTPTTGASEEFSVFTEEQLI